MRAETLHLIATLFRHWRGALNAIEKFERTVPKEHRASEVATAVEFARKGLVEVERTLYVDPTD